MLVKVSSLDSLFLLVTLGVLAGFLGSLTGLGGGVVITPALTLFLGVDLRYAIGASLVSAIATSSGAASAYVREGYSNVRIGLFLEVATTFGALFGAFIASWISTGCPGRGFRLVFCCMPHGSPRAITDHRMRPRRAIRWP